MIRPWVGGGGGGQLVVCVVCGEGGSAGVSVQAGRNGAQQCCFTPEVCRPGHAVQGGVVLALELKIPAGRGGATVSHREGFGG